MANHPNNVTSKEIAAMKALRAKGLTRREISEITGRSTRTLDRYLPPLKPQEAPRYDPTKHLAAYKASRPTEANEPKHLIGIAAANNGYGFPSVTQPLLGKLYALEAAPPARREFWRAA